MQGLPCRLLAEAHDVAAAGGCHFLGKHIRFVRKKAAGFGAAAVDSQIVGHRASSNIGAAQRIVATPGRGTYLYNAANHCFETSVVVRVRDVGLWETRLAASFTLGQPPLAVRRAQSSTLP